MAKAAPRIVVVTGASRGLGLAMTQRLIALGHTLVGCARSAAAMTKLGRRFGGPHAFTALDVADDGQVATWAQRSIQEVGPPDLLINNAALINRSAPLWEVPAAEFDALVAVNLSGVANVIRHFVPAMVKQRHGVIVNFSSGWGRSTSPEVAPYCATKWGIEGLTQALAEELPRGMAAVPLNPGIINTEMLQSAFGGDASAYPDPDEWAGRAVPFLLALGAKDNGQPLSVPGS